MKKLICLAFLLSSCAKNTTQVTYEYVISIEGTAVICDKMEPDGNSMDLKDCHTQDGTEVPDVWRASNFFHIPKDR